MNNSEPIFKVVFGSQWKNLPPVFQKHYANRPYSQDVSTVEGTMDISFSKFMSCFVPFFRLLNVLVPYTGKQIPVTVNFMSKPDSAVFCLDRKFYFPGRKPYEFSSHMKVTQPNEVIELMRFGIGWRMHYFYDGQKVVMQHKGYVCEILGLRIPLPLEIFIGKGHAEEEVIDENTYRVTMTMTHAWLGEMYRYAGDFKFKSLAL